MVEISQVQARALALAHSGRFMNWRSVVFELSFEPGYREAFDWLHRPSTQEQLDGLCRRAHESKDREGVSCLS